MTRRLSRGSWFLAALRARTQSTWPWRRRRRSWPPAVRIFVSHIRRESEMWKWCAPPTGKRGFRPTSSRSSTTWGGNSQLRTWSSAELTAAGKAAILIPLPTATDDHQRKNAEALASAGAAEVLLQKDLNGPTLAQRLLALAGDRQRRRQMSVAARALARPDAARVIVDRALALAKR